MKTKLYNQNALDAGVRLALLILLMNSIFPVYSFGQFGIDQNLPSNSDNYLSNTVPTIDNPYILFFLLSSLDVQLSQRQARIQWSTLCQYDSYDFTIERTLDGIQWEPMLQMKGQGSSTEESSYECIDENPYCNTSYNRLQVKDPDGEIQYSQVKAFYLSTIEGTGLLAYPNPANDQVILDGAANDISKLTILDEDGLDVSSNTSMLSYTNHLIIDVSTLPSGHYFLRTPENFVKLYKQ